MISRQVHARRRHQRRKTGDELRALSRFSTADWDDASEVGDLLAQRITVVGHDGFQSLNPGLEIEHLLSQRFVLVGRNFSIKRRLLVRCLGLVREVVFQNTAITNGEARARTTVASCKPSFMAASSEIYDKSIHGHRDPRTSGKRAIVNRYPVGSKDRGR